MNDRLMQYHHRRETLEHYLGKNVKAQGVLLFVSQPSINHQHPLACFASVRVCLDGIWKELDHLNIEVRKKVQLKKLKAFKTYQFQGQVYTYQQATNIEYRGHKMLASVQSYSLKKPVAFEQIEPYSFTELTRYQEHEARKLHLKFANLQKLPHEQRERLIIKKQKERN